MGYLRPVVMNSRTIAKGRLAKALAASEGETGDALLQRVIKYIPVEVVGTYVAVGNLLLQKDGTARPEYTTVYWIVFVAVLCATPFYMAVATIDWKSERTHDPVKWYQVVVSPVAFALWAFALGGPFAATYGWYDRTVASVTLIIGSFAVAGLDKFIDWLYQRRQSVDK